MKSVPDDCTHGKLCDGFCPPCKVVRCPEDGANRIRIPPHVCGAQCGDEEMRYEKLKLLTKSLKKKWLNTKYNGSDHYSYGHDYAGRGDNSCRHGHVCENEECPKCDCCSRCGGSCRCERMRRENDRMQAEIELAGLS